MKYDLPITSKDHAQWCLEEAARRYQGHVVLNMDGFPLVEDAGGMCHTDAILRAIGADWSADLIGNYPRYTG